jgi:hypothetical protein
VFVSEASVVNSFVYGIFFFQDEHAGSKSNSQKRIRGDYIGYVKEMMVRQQRDVSGANTCTRERK